MPATEVKAPKVMTDKARRKALEQRTLRGLADRNSARPFTYINAEPGWHYVSQSVPPGSEGDRASQQQLLRDQWTDLGFEPVNGVAYTPFEARRVGVDLEECERQGLNDAEIRARIVEAGGTVERNEYLPGDSYAEIWRCTEESWKSLRAARVKWRKQQLAEERRLRRGERKALVA